MRKFLPWWGFGAAALGVAGLDLLFHSNGELGQVLSYFMLVIAGGALLGGLARLTWWGIASLFRKPQARGFEVLPPPTDRP